MSLWRKLFRVDDKAKRKRSLKDAARIAHLATTGNLGRVFKELDCPVCFNTCIPPIHSCINGHIICNQCRENVQECPSCRQGFSGTRNFFAENFIANCSQQCRYAEEGCDYLRLKGDNMRPHEDNCMFRPIPCLIPTCGELVPYKSLWNHLTFHHKVHGSDTLPATITFHADQPIINNRKWLPFAIKESGNIFYVMMEVIRPNFWVWVWHQTAKLEEDYESVFTAQIGIRNNEKKLALLWEGPVQSLRSSPQEIMKEGLCFVAHEVFMQHFNSDGYFTLNIDIKKARRTTVVDINGNVEDGRMTTLSSASRNSQRSLYDSTVLRQNSDDVIETDNMNDNLPEIADPMDSFVSKASN